jgi:hypothetical protein
MAKRPAVHHWILCLEVQAVPPVAVNNFYDLLRVAPVHALAADVEFPASYERLDIFARFIGGTGSRSFEIQVLWVDSPKGIIEVALYGPMTVYFHPGQHVRDYNFRLNNVSLPGLGRYQFCLWIHGRRRKHLLAVEYLEVTQQP